MKISRRVFFKNASLAALSAGVLLQTKLPVSAQEIARAGFPIPAESQTDALAFLNQASFESCLNSYFYFQSETCGANLQLTAAKDTRPAVYRENAKLAAGECFSLTFRGSVNEPLEQDNYFVSHPALGAFSLLITVIGRNRRNFIYEAVINRLQPQ